MQKVPHQCSSVHSADKRAVAAADLFEVNGIAAIPFKGPALAQQLYGDITCGVT